MVRKPSDINIAGNGTVYYNLPVPSLLAEAVRRGEGRFADNGAFSVVTGKYTGRSPDDKFIIDDPQIHDEIAWGETNHPIEKDKFRSIKREIMAYLQNKDLFLFDGIAGADSAYSQKIRIINEYAYQNLFIQQLLRHPAEEQLSGFEPDYTVICAPGFSCIPELDGVHSETAILLDFVSRTVLIAGNLYCGEIKKAIFTVMNYVMPKKGVLPMHCSANMAEDGNTALFFGLSGTGKTTLSSTPDRLLIGDDEHGWSASGIFNMEGGCYAKCINLSKTSEPEIYNAIKFGSLLENVVLDEKGRPNYDDAAFTKNTRAAYPISYIERAAENGMGNAPSTIIFLTADAFGVLPPISRLDESTAIYYYLSGYTSKVAGTERGVSEPVATFSTMFGAPFFPLKPEVYAALLREKIKSAGCRIFLVNTGWCGGRAGDVPRLSLKHTRAMVSAAIRGELDTVPYTQDSIFGLNIPAACPGVPAELLDPAGLWQDQSEYTKQAMSLKNLFDENYAHSIIHICEK